MDIVVNISTNMGPAFKDKDIPSGID